MSFLKTYVYVFPSLSTHLHIMLLLKVIFRGLVSLLLLFVMISIFFVARQLLINYCETVFIQLILIFGIFLLMYFTLSDFHIC